MKRILIYVDRILSVIPIIYFISGLWFANSVYEKYKRLPFVDFETEFIKDTIVYNVFIIFSWLLVPSLLLKLITSIVLSIEYSLIFHRNTHNYIYFLFFILIVVLFSIDPFLFFDWFYFD